MLLLPGDWGNCTIDHSAQGNRPWILTIPIKKCWSSPCRDRSKTYKRIWSLKEKKFKPSNPENLTCACNTEWLTLSRSASPTLVEQAWSWMSQTQIKFTKTQKTSLITKRDTKNQVLFVRRSLVVGRPNFTTKAQAPPPCSTNTKWKCWKTWIRWRKSSTKVNKTMKRWRKRRHIFWDRWTISTTSLWSNCLVEVCTCSRKIL